MQSPLRYNDISWYVLTDLQKSETNESSLSYAHILCGTQLPCQSKLTIIFIIPFEHVFAVNLRTVHRKCMLSKNTLRSTVNFFHFLQYYIQNIKYELPNYHNSRVYLTIARNALASLVPMPWPFLIVVVCLAKHNLNKLSKVCKYICH